jgi:hypothetical protein
MHLTSLLRGWSVLGKSEQTRSEPTVIRSTVYHTGQLANDREYSPEVNTRANIAMDAFRRGEVHLLQRRIGGKGASARYEYLKVPRPTQQA